MANIGEQLVASYLRYIRKCDFVQTNVHTVDTQGEIDVLGINLKEKRVYLCEVAIHLTTGLQYVKGSQTINVQKLTDKFSRDIAYGEKFLAEYNKHYMLWSPVVKDSKGNPANNQLLHLSQIQNNIRARFGVELECIVNSQFAACLDEMRSYAGRQSAELLCPVMRMYQIEAYLDKHVARMRLSAPSTVTPCSQQGEVLAVSSQGITAPL